jgi:ubiquinone/menaquinone biosynthesis C-methylase UbiE
MGLANSNGRPSGVYDSEIVMDIRNKLNLQKNDLVLNIGCGTGVLERLSPNLRIVSMDFSKQMLKRNFIDNAVIADGSHLPFRIGVFNKILVYSVIQYFKKDELRLMLKDISACLRPNGVCLIGDVELRRTGLWDLIRFLYSHLSKKKLFNYYSRSWLSKELERMNLKLKIVKQASGLPFSGKRIDVLVSRQEMIHDSSFT